MANNIFTFNIITYCAFSGLLPLMHINSYYIYKFICTHIYTYLYELCLVNYHTIMTHDDRLTIVDSAGWHSMPYTTVHRQD